VDVLFSVLGGCAWVLGIEEVANVATRPAERRRDGPGRWDGSQPPLFHALLLDDGSVDLDGIVHSLRSCGFATLVAETTQEAVRLGRRWKPHLAIVAAGLPHCAELVGDLHASGISVLLIGTAEQLRMLPKRSILEGRILAPAPAVEVAAAAQALVPGNGVPASKTPIQIGPLRLDLARRLVFMRGRRVELPPREFALLAALAMQPDEPIDREELGLMAWPDDLPPAPQDVYRRVYRLKRLLGDDQRRPPLIRNRPGFGYVLEDPGARSRGDRGETQRS
jgi:two-component system KDP operon response regulator KdpE